MHTLASIHKSTITYLPLVFPFLLLSLCEHSSPPLTASLRLLVAAQGYVSIYIYVCMYICMYVHMYVCMYVCMYIYVHICTYMYIYVYICIYTHMKHVVMRQLSIFCAEEYIHMYTWIVCTWCWDACMHECLQGHTHTHMCNIIGSAYVNYCICMQAYIRLPPTVVMRSHNTPNLNLVGIFVMNIIILLPWMYANAHTHA